MMRFSEWLKLQEVGGATGVAYGSSRKKKTLPCAQVEGEPGGTGAASIDGDPIKNSKKKQRKK